MIDSMKIRYLMFKTNTTHKQIAKLLKVSQGTLHSRFKNNDWSFNEIWLISQYLDVEIKKLMKEDDADATNNKD